MWVYMKKLVSYTHFPYPNRHNFLIFGHIQKNIYALPFIFLLFRVEKPKNFAYTHIVSFLHQINVSFR